MAVAVDALGHQPARPPIRPFQELGPVVDHGNVDVVVPRGQIGFFQGVVRRAQELVPAAGPGPPQVASIVVGDRADVVVPQEHIIVVPKRDPLRQVEPLESPLDLQSDAAGFRGPELAPRNDADAIVFAEPAGSIADDPNVAQAHGMPLDAAQGHPQLEVFTVPGMDQG